jgi:hypothetical protein
MFRGGEQVERVAGVMGQSETDRQWLQKYMFQGRIDAEEKAEAITDYLPDYQQFMSHDRRVDRDALRSVGVRVVDLEADQQLQDRVLSVYHSVSHTMTHSGTVNIIENHLGKGMFRAVNVVGVGGLPVPAQPGDQAVPSAPGVIPSGPPMSRQQRRATARKSQ